MLIIINIKKIDDSSDRFSLWERLELIIIQNIWKIIEMLISNIYLKRLIIINSFTKYFEYMLKP